MTDPGADAAVLAELGRRIEAVRSAAKLTQEDLAKAAGIAKGTVGRLEAGDGSHLVNLVRCLRVLNLADGVVELLPAPRYPRRARAAAR